MSRSGTLASAFSHNIMYYAGAVAATGNGFVAMGPKYSADANNLQVRVRIM
jgi:hypothetical protein